MNYLLRMAKNNEFKRPWLIQRATVLDWTKGRVGNCIRFDYMGSSEYEWGAVPQALRNYSDNKLHDLEPKLLKIGAAKHRVWILVPEYAVEPYRLFLEEMAAAASVYDVRLKEIIELQYILRGDEVPTYQRNNFWLDLENPVVLSQSKYDLLGFKKALPESIKYMDEKKVKNENS